MVKLKDALGIEFKCANDFKFVRVSAFISAVVTRVESACFCRYSCISDNIVK